MKSSTDSDHNSTVTIIILCTADGSRHEFQLPLSSTLNSLKAAISNHPALSKRFGSSSAFDQQRFFYLGRELKSGHRSLSTLGIGRFENYVIHLHSKSKRSMSTSTNTQTRMGSHHDDDDDDEEEEDHDSDEDVKIVPSIPSSRGKVRFHARHTVTDSMTPLLSSAWKTSRTNGSTTQVIDLLDDTETFNNATTVTSYATLNPIAAMTNVASSHIGGKESQPQSMTLSHAHIAVDIMDDSESDNEKQESSCIINSVDPSYASIAPILTTTNGRKRSHPQMNPSSEDTALDDTTGDDSKTKSSSVISSSETMRLRTRTRK